MFNLEDPSTWPEAMLNPNPTVDNFAAEYSSSGNPSGVAGDWYDQVGQSGSVNERVALAQDNYAQTNQVLRSLGIDPAAYWAQHQDQTLQAQQTGDAVNRGAREGSAVYDAQSVLGFMSGAQAADPRVHQARQMSDRFLSQVDPNALRQYMGGPSVVDQQAKIAQDRMQQAIGQQVQSARGGFNPAALRQGMRSMSQGQAQLGQNMAQAKAEETLARNRQDAGLQSQINNQAFNLARYGDTIAQRPRQEALAAFNSVVNTPKQEEGGGNFFSDLLGGVKDVASGLTFGLLG